MRLPYQNEYATYIHYGAGGEVLYVGVAERFLQRQREHEKNSAWWPEVCSTTFEIFPDKNTARWAEKRAIKRLKPRHNIIYNKYEDCVTISRTT